MTSSEAIFYNTSSVSFVAVPGNFVQFDENNISQETVEPENPLAPIVVTVRETKTNKNALIGATPSFRYKTTNTGPNTAPEKILEKPLIKAPKDNENIVYNGLRSGGRSAILISTDTNKIYRLKGKKHLFVHKITRKTKIIYL